MKYLYIVIAAFSIVLVLGSCGKDNSVSKSATNTGTVKTVTGQTLTVSVNTSQIKADGVAQVVFTVRDNSNVDITASSIIYVNDIALKGNTFSTTTPGSYLVKAVKDDVSSSVVDVIASNSTSSVFIQKTLAEFYTGTWCGICPGTEIPFESYVDLNPNTIMVGIHGPSGSADPFQYVYDTQLRNTFGVLGVPEVILNRNNRWDRNNSSLDKLSLNQAILGVGIQTTVSGASSISVKTQVKFGTAINTPLKLVVMLVEDSISYNQVNYGYFNLPNPIVNYFHRNVLRVTATDVFGDAIPANQQFADNVWERNFTIDASSYVLAKCKVVAFVLYDSNSQGLKGVLNAQIVKAGRNINF